MEPETVADRVGGRFGGEYEVVPWREILDAVEIGGGGEGEEVDGAENLRGEGEEEDGWCDGFGGVWHSVGWGKNEFRCVRLDVYEAG